MKITLLFFLFTALLIAVSMPTLSAASSSARVANTAVSALQTDSKTANSKQIKKSKRSGWFKKWWESKVVKRFQKIVQRWSLGFVGFLVMILGGMFIVLGIVIPYLGILFLVIGIILAFVWLLLWVLLSMIGIQVSSDDGRYRRQQ
jgi:Flp pilus assembly protein TadB